MSDITDMLDLDVPKRIYDWQHSHLSIARHYGGCTINGVTYCVRYDVEGQPLEELRVKRRAKKAAPGKDAL
jgi:hypothetical protein